eukprot:scaffold3504_cov240-Pinguiococcus_pyrenoidosus.AAC.29
MIAFPKDSPRTRRLPRAPRWPLCMSFYPVTLPLVAPLRGRRSWPTAAEESKRPFEQIVYGGIAEIDLGVQSLEERLRRLPQRHELLRDFLAEAQTRYVALTRAEALDVFDVHFDGLSLLAFRPVRHPPDIQLASVPLRNGAEGQLAAAREAASEPRMGGKDGEKAAS